MREAAFLGWFGPIGVSTTYYLVLIRDRTGLDQVWQIGSMVVALSVVLHGITATPGMQVFAHGSPKRLVGDENAEDETAASE